MYISEATHDALCQAGIWAICLLIGGMCLAVAMPWIMRKLKIAYLHVMIAWCDVRLAAIRLYLRIANAAHRARNKRRQRIAMKVFENPVRWEGK